MKQNYEKTPAELLAEQEVSAERGLSAAEVEARFARFGGNVFEKPRKQKLILRILAQFKDVSVIILLIAAVCALFLLSRSGSFSIAGAAVLLLIFLLYITENIRSAKRDTGAEETGKAPASDRRSIVLNILRIVGGAACIVVGSQLLVSNGSLIAASWGVSEAIIGVTIVAIGTSLPELVTAVTSLIKKQSSMSVGNVIGANVIDTTLILAVCSFVYGGKLPVSAQNIYLDFPVAIVVTLIAIIPTIVCRRFQRWQGVLMLAVYIAYLVVVTTGLDWYLALVA